MRDAKDECPNFPHGHWFSFITGRWVCEYCGAIGTAPKSEQDRM